MTQKTINGLTAEQHLKKEILFRSEVVDMSQVINLDMLEEIYGICEDNGDIDDVCYDTRSGDYNTGLPCESSRHYETDAVAIKTADGIYIGWTWWHGGGKHSEPEAIPWIDGAYFLDCTEEEVVAIRLTFTKPS